MQLSKNVIRSMSTDIKNKRAKADRLSEEAHALTEAADALQHLLDKGAPVTQKETK